MAKALTSSSAKSAACLFVLELNAGRIRHMSTDGDLTSQSTTRIRPEFSDRAPSNCSFPISQPHAKIVFVPFERWFTGVCDDAQECETQPETTGPHHQISRRLARKAVAAVFFVFSCIAFTIWS
jgi:hypothetical protein